MTTPGTARRAERECTACPPWTLRCVHYGDVRIGLLGRDTKPQGCKLCQSNLMSVAVIAIRGDLISCPNCGRARSGYYDNQEIYCVHFPDLPSAEAEFYRREAELLGREVGE